MVVDESSIFVVIVDDKNLPLVVAAVFFFFLPAAIDSFPSSIFSHHESSKARHMVVLPIPARPATIIFNETIRGLSFNDSGDPIEFVVVNIDFSSVVFVGIFEDSNDDDSSGELSIESVVIVDFVDIIVAGDDDEATTTPTLLRHRRPNKKINIDSEIIL